MNDNGDASGSPASRPPPKAPQEQVRSTTALMAISPIDGRYAAKTQELCPLFSEWGLMRQRLRVEIEWLLALVAEPSISDTPVLDEQVIAALRGIVSNFGAPAASAIKSIESTTRHDVKAVEYYLGERLQEILPEAQRGKNFLHFACTSEDINNLSYALMLREARETLLLPAIDRLVQILRALAHTHAAVPMLARTHGQPASPTTMGKEMAVFVSRLARQRGSIAGSAIRGKLNGAVGNYNAHLSAYPEVDWHLISRTFVTSLGLEWNPYTTQVESRDDLAALLDAIVRCNNIVLDLCRDCWSYIALGYFVQHHERDAVGSSTMPHKINPIEFENAEGNIGIANALLSHLSATLPISRLQRDLSCSTAMRNIGSGIAYTLIAFDSCTTGLSKLSLNKARLASDLDAAWEVLAEPIQTVMRRYGLPLPYERLKVLTQGQAIDKTALHNLIGGLPLPEAVRSALLQLTPASYTGAAERLARDV